MASHSSLDECHNIPIPSSIVLYNRLPSLLSNESRSKKWFRLDHTTNLLVSVRLEIFLKNGEEESKVIFSSQYENSSIHPMWNYLNEKIKDWEQHWAEQSTSAFVRIFLIDKGDISLLVDSVPLHPKSLRRLPSDEDDSRLIQSPPSALPPNAVLIHYTDGLVRVEASLYHILLKQGIIHERDPGDASLIIDDVEEDRRASRFHDDLFAVLDQVEDETTSGPKNMPETDDENMATPVLATENGSLEFSEVSSSSNYGSTEVDAEVEDWLNEKDRLLAKIAAEEVLLFDDRQDLELQQHELRSTMEHVEQLRKVESLIREEIRHVISHKEELELSIDIYQIKLLKELQQIYPISNKAGERYAIAGAELPSDIFGGEISEDEISAALGFLAHSIVMMSKYLSIPLRHRIVCNSSRSAIQEEGANILPLFLARNGERQSLERGMVLLNRNVDCISKTRGLECSKSSHLLGKTLHIYQKVLKSNHKN